MARRPPIAVMEQIKGLNQALQLGNMLCRSRKPDFLLSIIERQVRALTYVKCGYFTQRNTTSRQENQYSLIPKILRPTAAMLSSPS